MSTIWVTSDTHFNHDGILKHCDRPASNVTEMNEKLIERWNERVKPQDTIWHLGDSAYPYKHDGHITYDELASRLNGIKHLVRGNHDSERMKGGQESDHIWQHPMWESVQDYFEFKFGKSRFVFCHYPFQTWRNAHHGWYHLHGHCHGTLKVQIPHRWDVGVDVNLDFAPYNLEELRDFFAKQEDYKPQDHHGD